MVKVTFIHPDLGIGGAERLVVDAAIALKSKEHEVSIVTSHHDPSHCFEETRNGQLKIIPVGDWLPRRLFGKFYALFATIRMITAAIYLTLFSGLKPDVIICDQISNAIPFLRLFSSAKIIFYCHYPDQLLTERNSFWKITYRYMMDFLEEWTMGMADIVLVNSKFTRNVFKNTFKSLKHLEPSVLYPSLNTEKFDQVSTESADKTLFTCLSINRYERKKNIGLAIESFAKVVQSSSSNDLKLIVAGGYDHRVEENKEYYKELVLLAEDNGISSKVEFLKSPPDEEKVTLLKTSDCLIYTPSGEHFGIVPIEASYCKIPVIAVNDGGPTETIVHNETGYLCQPTPEDFAKYLNKLKHDSTKNKQRMGQKGRERVISFFSFDSFATKLNDFVIESLNIR